MYKIKNPMKSIDLLDDYFRYEILEYVPEKKQVILCHSTNTIWFGDVNIFLIKLKNILTQLSIPKNIYEHINLDKLIEAVENKYKQQEKL
ncbi:MAG: hypothetical protein CBC48_12545 [bacterium TMED88]|nr:MAG: hypothetical protein CBC48_12545 [bacterium TMED88]